MAGEKTSNNIRKFCRDFGITLNIFEERTQWANKDELYIGLIKKTSRKYMKESDCPIAFWEYCVERHARINKMMAEVYFNIMDPMRILNLEIGGSKLSQTAYFIIQEACG